MSVRLADVIAAMDAAYPPALAESWDSVGLVCGDPADAVSRILLAVDATAAVVDEAVDWGAQALVVHHPLLLRGVDTVGAHTPKGALVHRLIRGGCALFTAHTNADSADPGVSDALAAAIGVRVTGPLDAAAGPAVDKWAVMVPSTDTDRVQAALFAAGGGRIGDYAECSWRVAGVGQFRPLDGANPTIGAVGRVEEVAEDRVDMVAPRRLRGDLVEALRAAHPYEEPAFDVFELAGVPGAAGLGRAGLGRVGELVEPESLRAFTARVRDGLPATAWGVRAAGDPDAPVRTVAVCGGSGDSFLGAVSRLGVDAYVTADLRHHPADEHLRAGGPALVDVAHWASEFPWCAQAAGVLSALPGVTTKVSALRTDPWTLGEYGE
ncbi:MAG TPA: Nif3-like dinuclear metal center hexameric protein [Aldersonia sp.]